MSSSVGAASGRRGREVCEAGAGVKVLKVDEFKFLGSIIPSNRKHTREVVKREQAEWGGWGSICGSNICCNIVWRCWH